MISWKLHEPGTATVTCLDQISEFRGRVLYANGRRPAFRLSTGRFADPDPLDPQAYHIVARNKGQSIGCVRNVPLFEGVSCLTERLIGKRKFAEMLTTFGIGIKGAVECSRWMVDPEFRQLRLGILLAGGAVAAAHAFGFELLFCSVGTRDKQDRVLSRLGLRRVPGLPLIPVPDYNDELCVMYIQPHRPPLRMAELMAEMNLELKLKPGKKSGDQRPAQRTPQQAGWLP